MIIRSFDQGWGPEWPAKQFEQQLLNQFLQPLVNSSCQAVTINSTWYSKDYHQQVSEQLRNLDFTHIVLISMLDAAIPQPSWYEEFGRPCLSVGYYPGDNFVDYWALLLDHCYQPLDNLLDATQIDQPYMCLNRKPHWHRKQLYDQLLKLNLVDKGLVSMGNTKFLSVDREPDTLAPNFSSQHYGIPNDIVSLGHEQNWRRHFLNIVTETVFDIDQSGFVSEKIYKPIVGCRPFLVYAQNGAVAWLQSRGFETYTQDFNDITDLDLSQPYNLAPFLQVLCQQPSRYWVKKFLDLQHKILYNKNHFARYVQSQKNQIHKGIQCQI